MKVWEETPDGRKGWAPLLAEKGREVITIEWACNSPEIYRCSGKELCSLTQKENMDLIKKVIEKALSKDRKIVFLGWSMGGPQVFKLAADIIPRRVVAVMGYGATGPLNYFQPSSSDSSPKLNYNRRMTIAKEWVEKQSRMVGFPRKHLNQYLRKYLIPFSPLMAAIQSKRPEVKNYWSLLTIKNPHNLPPTLLVNGTFDSGHSPDKEKKLKDWLKKYQGDTTAVYVKDFSHLGMMCRGNEKIVKLYLGWLKKRNL